MPAPRLCDLCVKAAEAAWSASSLCSGLPTQEQVNLAARRTLIFQSAAGEGKAGKLAI